MTTYRWTLLRAGRLLLDGGGMFGLIPRVVWGKTVPTDDKGRIELAHNCLLLESTNTTRPLKVILECGTGDKLDPKMAEVFGLDGATMESALIAAGHDPASIDAAIVTHLHFDHAGGLTRRVRPGETPDAVVPPAHRSGDADAVKLTLPRAEIIVQRQEWHDARANNSVMTRTYFRDHLDPLMLPLPDGRERLRLVDSPRPYPAGGHPDRSAQPLGSAAIRRTEVLPGIFVLLVPGHTWGQQAMMFTDERNRTVVFTPDVMPTVWHSGAAYSLAYDVEPYTSMLSRRWFLEEAAAADWLLCLDHEPKTPLVRVRDNGKGWWNLIPES